MTLIGTREALVLDTGVPLEVFPLAPVLRWPQVPPLWTARCLPPGSPSLPPTRQQKQVSRSASWMPVSTRKIAIVARPTSNHRMMLPQLRSFQT